jgi:hypothetical protein
MRERRTYGSGRGARGETRVPTATGFCCGALWSRLAQRGDGPSLEITIPCGGAAVFVSPPASTGFAPLGPTADLRWAVPSAARLQNGWCTR